MPLDPFNYEDFSFLALRLVLRREGRHLVSREAAEQLASNVLEHYYGPERHRLNLPLVATDAENGDDWQVCGSAPRLTAEIFWKTPSKANRFEIHINKYNARITKMIFT